MSERNAVACWMKNPRRVHWRITASSSCLDARRIVFREPDHRHVEGGQGRGRVEIAAILGLLDQEVSSGA